MTTKNEILRRLNRIEEQADEHNAVMIFDSRAEYDAFKRNGGKCKTAIIDDIPRKDR